MTINVSLNISGVIVSMMAIIIIARNSYPCMKRVTIEQKGIIIETISASESI